jgi:hypothetical protein
MIDRADLCFDTRAQSLTSLVTLARSGSWSQRVASLSLLANTAPPSLEATLTALALAPDDDRWFNTYALRALQRMGAVLSTRDYLRLLGDASRAFDRDDAVPSRTAIAPSDVVSLATSPALVELALAWVEGLSITSVTRLLETLAWYLDDAPRPVVDALVSRWLNGLPTHLDAPALHIAERLADTHPRALDLLATHWGAQIGHDDAGVVAALSNTPALATRLRGHPAMPALAQRELLAPTGSLADALGAMPFARTLRNAVLRWSATLRVPGANFETTVRLRYTRAVEHLTAWKHGDIVASQLVRAATLADDVFDDLVLVWHAHAPEAALAWFEAHLRAQKHFDRYASLVARLAEVSEPDDAPFFHRMLDVPSESLRAVALRALDARSDGERWIATLHALATDRGAVGERARVCLAQRGDARALEALRAVAFDDAVADRGARNAALRALARVPGEVHAHRARFERALTESSNDRGATIHLVDIADALLTHVGHDACPAVLRAYLTATCDALSTELGDTIASHGILSER